MSRIAERFGQIAVVFLFLFAFLQPISIAAAFVAYSLLACTWLIRLALVPRGALKSSPLDLPILVYLLLCALSALLSPLPASGWEGMRKVNLVFLAIVVAHNIPTLRRARQLVGVLLLGTLLSITYAGWILATGVGLHLNDVKAGSVFFKSGLRGDDVILRVDNHLILHPIQFFDYLKSTNGEKPVRLLVVNDGGFDVMKDAVPVVIPRDAMPHSSDATDWGVSLQKEKLGRARGFYSHPVTYAEVLSFLACLAFGLWLVAEKRWTSPAGLALMGLCGILGLTLGATLTRAAWLAFAFGCVLIVWMHDRRPKVRLSLPLLLILAAVGANTATRHFRGVGLIDSKDLGSQYRMEMWREGIHLALAHPWFGVGMNSIRDDPSAFKLPAESKFGLWSHFHSTPIQLAATQGFPVFIAWLVLMGCFLALLVQLANKALKQQTMDAYGLALGMLGGAVAFLISSVVQYNFGDSVVALQFWFFVGLALALRRHLQGTTSDA